MPSFRWSGVDAVTLGQSVAQYCAVNGLTNAASTSEVVTQTRVRDTLTVTNLFVYVNAITGSDGVARTRKNTANGAVSVTLNATGIFENAGGPDSLVSGDVIGIQLVGPTMHGDSMQCIAYGAVVTHATDTVPILVGSNPVATSISFGVTRYYRISGTLSNESGETNAQRTFRTGATLSKLHSYCSAYSLDVAATVRTRQNAGNGAQSVSVNATGLFEDTTNTDAVAVADEVNYGADTTAAASGTITLTLMHVKAANGAQVHICAPFGVGADTYGQIDSIDTSTEASVQVTIRTTNVQRNLYVYTSVYSRDAASAVYLRQNGANSAVSVSVNATGVIEDLTNSITPVATDELNFFNDLGGTTGSWTLQIASIEEVDVPFLMLPGAGMFENVEQGAMAAIWRY